MKININFIYRFFILYLILTIASNTFANDQENYTYKLTQSVSEYEIWTTTPAQKVFKDDPIPSATGSDVSVYIAKNEFEPFQIVVKPLTSGKIDINIQDFGAGIKTG